MRSFFTAKKTPPDHTLRQNRTPPKLPNSVNNLLFNFGSIFPFKAASLSLSFHDDERKTTATTTTATQRDGCLKAKA